MNTNEKMELMESEALVQEMLRKRNLGTEGCVLTSEIARKAGLSTSDLNSFLLDQGILCRQRGVLMPTDKNRRLGLTKQRSSFKFTAQGKLKEIVYPVWTKKGVVFLEGVLKIRIKI